MNEVPIGLCQCGCGQTTTIAPWADPRWGVVRGQPRRFIRGHNPATRKGPKPRSLEERFWEKVDVSGGPNSCWLWLGVMGATGYGQIGVGSTKDHTARSAKAHRVLWELSFGSIR